MYDADSNPSNLSYKNYSITKVEAYFGCRGKAKEYLSRHTREEAKELLRVGETTLDRYYRQFNIRPVPICRVCKTRDLSDFKLDSKGRVQHGLCVECEKACGPRRPKKPNLARNEHLPIGRFTAEHSELEEFEWNMIRTAWGTGLPASYWVQEKDIENLYPG